MSWIITGTEKYETDPYRSQVSLLLHGDGTNGSTTITDSSPSPKTVTAFGDAQISTAQSKFGGSSLAFDGTGDYLQFPDDPSFEFGSSPFTIECFIYLTALPDYFDAHVYSARNDPLQTGVVLAVRTNLKLRFYRGPGLNNLESNSSLQLNTWHHIAVTRSSNTVTLWLDGINVGSRSLAVSLGSNPIIRISSVVTDPTSIPGAFVTGYIDDLRVTKGVARYTSNFTPPTAPFPDI